MVKTILLLLLITFTIGSPSFAYSDVQLSECVLGSKRNPILVGVPERFIKNYCDCAVTRIVDAKEDVDSSVIFCAKENFK